MPEGVPATLFDLYIRHLSKDNPLQDKQVTEISNDLYLLVGPSQNITEYQVEELLSTNRAGVVDYCIARRQYDAEALNLIQRHAANDSYIKEHCESQGSMFRKRALTRTKHLQNEIEVLDELIRKFT
jgi:hypothetical protein